MKIDKEKLLAGEVDPNEVGIKDVREFVKEQGLDYLKFHNGTPIQDCLNILCDALEGSETEAEEPTGDDNKDAAEAAINEQAGADTSTPATGFLARRAEQIAREKAAHDGMKSVSGELEYSENAPAFLKRRMAKPE